MLADVGSEGKNANGRVTALSAMPADSFFVRPQRGRNRLHTFIL